MSKVYIISGPDASGKSTQIHRLETSLEEDHQVRTVWLRHRHYISLIPLLFARLLGCTITEEVNGYTHQYHRFEQRRGLGYLYTICLWFDLLLAYTFFVYIPIKRGEVVICDRGPLDTLIDLRFKLNIDYRRNIMERIFLALPPSEHTTVILATEPEVLMKRIPKLRSEQRFRERVQWYQNEANRLDFEYIDADNSEEYIFNKLQRLLKN